MALGFNIKKINFSRTETLIINEQNFYGCCTLYILGNETNVFQSKKRHKFF